MKKTISTLAIAAVSCALFGSSAQAQSRMDETLIERRTTTQTVEEPEVRVAPKTRVMSGETLAGRREPIANDAVIVQDGDERRAIFREGGELEDAKVRGYLGEGEIEVEDDEIEFDD